VRLSIPLTGGVLNPRYVGRAVIHHYSRISAINAAWTAVIMAPADYSCVTKAEDPCRLSAFTIHIMYSYHYALGPTCRGSVSLYVPPLNYKREGTHRCKGQTQTHAYTHTHSIQHSYSGGRVLRFGGLNHYNPSSPLVFILNPPNRQIA
jgi:hypothetical protein